jgi:hypothetical protein
MPEIQIDATSDEDVEVSVENAELSWIRIAVAGVTLELRWEQADSLFRNLRPFFDDDTAT